MKFRTTLILLAVNIVAILFLFFHTGRQLSDDEYARQQRRVFPAMEYQEPGAMLEKYLGERAVRITLEQGESRIVMERNEPKPEAAWHIVAPIQTLADAKVVEELLMTLEQVESERTVELSGGREADLKPYGVDGPSRSVSFSTPEKSWTLRIGNPTLDGKGVYALRTDHPQRVLVIPRDFLKKTGHTVATLRDKAALRFVPARVTGIELRAAGVPLYACRSTKSGWKVVEPFEDEADIQEVGRVVSSLARMGVHPNDFISDSPELKDEYGLGEHAITLTVLEGTKRKSLIIGARYQAKHTGFYAKRADENAVFILPETSVVPLIRQAHDMRAKLAMLFAMPKVAGITLDLPDRQVKLMVKDNRWQSIEPAGISPDNEQVKAFLAELGTLRVRRWIDAVNDEALAQAGLDKPAAKVTLLFTNGLTRSLAFGGPAEDQTLRHTRRNGEGPILLVDGAFCNKVQRGHLLFIARTAIEFPPESATSIEIDRPSGAIALARSGGSWQLTRPVSGNANDGAVQDLLWKLSYVETQSIVARKAADPAQYGLDKPRLRVRATVKDGPQPPALLIGKRAGPGAVFAMAGDSPMVFKINDAILKCLNAEFASDVVCSFNPAQANELEVILENAEQPFRFQKKGDTWHMAGEAEPWPQAWLITASVAELAKLRAESLAGYDKNALTEPPAVTLQVTLGEKTRRVIQLRTAENGYVVTADDTPYVFRLTAERMPETTALAGKLRK